MNRSKFVVFCLVSALSACAGVTTTEDVPGEPTPQSGALSASCPDGSAPPVRDGAIFCTCSGDETVVSGLAAGDRYCLDTDTILLDATRYSMDQDHCIDITDVPDPVTIYGHACFYPGR